MGADQAQAGAHEVVVDSLIADICSIYQLSQKYYTMVVNDKCQHVSRSTKNSQFISHPISRISYKQKFSSIGAIGEVILNS